MPNQLSRNKQRISYAEDREVLEKLLAICRREHCTLTEVIREAVALYLKERKKKKRRRKQTS